MLWDLLYFLEDLLGLYGKGSPTPCWQDLSGELQEECCISSLKADDGSNRSVTFGLPPPSTPLDDRSIPIPAKLWYSRGTSIQPTNAAFPTEEEEEKWIQDEAVDPAGIIRPQDYLAAFWIKSNNVKKEPQQGAIEVVMYLVGGGYITGTLALSLIPCNGPC